MKGVFEHLRAYRKYRRVLKRTAGVHKSFVVPPKLKTLQLRRKTSDTIFILASGQSVANYESCQWDHIATHDSVGFNYWMIHEFVPTFYLAEIPADPALSDAMFENLMARRIDYAGTFVTLKFRDTRIKQLRKYAEAGYTAGLSFPRGISRVSELGSEGEKLARFETDLARLLQTGMLHANWFDYTQTASVDMLTLWAFKLGYKSIVLCGVDLDTAYFYETADYQTSPMVVPKSGQTGAVHKTNDPKACAGGVTISNVLESIQTNVLTPAGASLYSSIYNTQLSRFLPTYWGKSEDG